jgi:hypothetical protein
MRAVVKRSNIVRMITSRRVSWVGHGRGMYRVLVGKPEGKRPMGRYGRRWEDIIKD